MNTKQTIAIIGATGNMGSGISKKLSNGNFRLLLFANQLSKLQTLEAEILEANPSADIEVTACPTEASWEADIIILAVAYPVQQQIAQKIKEVANQKIVISIANPLNDTYDGLVTAPDSSAAEELQKLLPNSKVIKAFNTVFAADFAQPVIADKQADAFIAGDDQGALQTVSELVVTAGFNPIIAGALKVSRTLESMSLLLIQLNIKNNYNWLAGWKILHQ
ncbi:NADPH-dependent F420 reductase [Dyadobacter psychrotolerans]|uniref:NADP oxidoreductase n=1 Tax=Dyadobacter psychrotolerans TaxID=2541721 RepID=A0A4R5DYC0_9BACT|nr:NAD(P)-binding domain-containing protein [Dyadobacter psychrotolerans]TDE16143.1 NADP oxidoreductase [Dyadobacter psychrotolerans]